MSNKLSPYDERYFPKKFFVDEVLQTFSKIQKKINFLEANLSNNF